MLESIIGSIAPYVAQQNRKTSATTGLNRLGSGGTNLYYCYNYMSSQHCDEDVTWTISMQLRKEGENQKDEYNFSYTEWGVYLVTEDKCIW